MENIEIKNISISIPFLIKQSKKRRIHNMWFGWIVGAFGIVITIMNAMDIFMLERTTPLPPLYLLLILAFVNTFAFTTSIILIYISFLTKREIRAEKQEEILNVLEKDEI